MTDDPVRTIAESDQGVLAFQEYYMQPACHPILRRLQFAGTDEIAE